MNVRLLSFAGPTSSVAQHGGGAAVHDPVAGPRLLGEAVHRCALLHQGQHPQVVLLPAVLSQGEPDGVGAGAVREDRGDATETVPNHVRGTGNCLVL